MKIKSIRKVGPELFLVSYSRRLLPDFERYAVVEPTEPGILQKIEYTIWFRDTGEPARNCCHQIEWMIRNDVEFFDNIEWDGKEPWTPNIILNIPEPQEKP